MKKFYEQVIRYRYVIMVIFAVAAVICAFCRQFIQVNYDMTDYLPPSAASSVSLDVMSEEFDGAIPNARVMVKAADRREALAMKEQLEAIDGVESVSWLDDVVSMDMPFSMYPTATLEKYYKDGYALYNVTVEEDKRTEAVDAMYEVVGEDGALTGSAVSTAVATESTVTEIRKIAIIAVLFLLVILMITTTSWLEPLVVMAGLGIAIVINAGSNLIFGEISFVTNAAGNILQLAVSLDYSVFLIHRFDECRHEVDSPKEAMKNALVLSTSAILSSGLTTVIGFLALVIMKFQIGPDLGLALAKGICISLLTVFLFMPGLILLTYEWMDKTAHRPFLPSFRRLGKGVRKITLPLGLIFILLMIPTYVMSNNNSYYYGSSHIFGADTRIGEDKAKIEAVFGKNDNYVLMVPRGDDQKEKELAQELEEMDEVKSITALRGMLGNSLPAGMVPNALLEKLQSDNYDRMVLNVGVDYEGSETFALVEKIRKLAKEYYGDDCYLAGEGVSTYDLMETTTADMVKVNLIAIGAVFLILVLTMHSLILPLVLVLTIETAIWINLSIPYLTGSPVFYIAYLIISSIQLGATVDYAILLTERYKENRQQLDRRDSIVETIRNVTASILTSGITMTVIGFLLGIISSHQLLSQLGYFLGRGTLCSMFAVLFVLPGFLYLTDRWAIKDGKGQDGGQNSGQNNEQVGGRNDRQNDRQPGGRNSGQPGRRNDGQNDRQPGGRNGKKAFPFPRRRKKSGDLA